MQKMIKKKIYETLEPTGGKRTRIGRFFDIFILFLIFLNILAVVLSTIQSLSKQFHSYFFYFEFFSVIVFTIEYILRIWSCNVDKKYQHPFAGRVKFAFRPIVLIDLLAILPFYLPMIIPLDLRFIRAIRLLRLFRIFKIGRYSKSLNVLKDVIRNKKEELVLIIFVVLIMLVIFSSLMYFVERDVQPEAFASIPHAMWWAIITLTTVGYGDVYPITVLGKILGAMIAFLGIGMFALPAGILGSGLIEAIQKRDDGLISKDHENKKLDKVEIDNIKKTLSDINKKLDQILKK